MAHPLVEKAKSFGFRHGEKVAVALTSVLCVVLVILAGSRKAIDVTPTQIKKAAESARNNLQQPQSKEDILARLDSDGLVPVPFTEKVAAAAAAAKGANEVKYAFTVPFMSPEPGAGLIRETPVLLAPTELYVSANRGSITLFVRDESGAIVYEEAKKDKPKPPPRRRRNSMMGSGMMGSGMMGSGSSGMMDGMGGIPKEPTAAEKKKAEEEARRKAQLFVGTARDKEEEEIETKAAAGETPKEAPRGVRIAAIAGALDHKAIKDNYVRALKDANAAPHYLRLDLERQERVGDGWGEWTAVDQTVNEEVESSLTETEEELATEDTRLEGLVETLPFFKVGYYSGVHMAEFVPKEKREAPKPADTMMMGSGGKMGAMMGSMGSSMMGSGMMGSDSADMMGSGKMGAMMGSGMMGDSSMMMGSSGMMMGSSGMMMGGGPGMGPGGPADPTFPRTDAERIMVRGLDFTVAPDTAYRYRVRIVVRNPNKGWDTVAPGTDSKSDELFGPWSEVTEAVAIPADVATFALGKSTTSRRDDAIEFQVVRWNPSDGITVVTRVSGAPGQVIGGPDTARVPNEDGKGTTSKAIDFTSRQLLIDTVAAQRPLAGMGTPGVVFDAPVQALIIRPDGTLVLRDEARDTADDQRAQLKNLYDQILDDANKGGKKSAEQQMGSSMMGSGMMMGPGS
jgi:hypothetical protein